MTNIEIERKIDEIMGEIISWGLSDSQNKRARELLLGLCTSYEDQIDFMFNDL